MSNSHQQLLNDPALSRNAPGSHVAKGGAVLQFESFDFLQCAHRSLPLLAFLPGGLPTFPFFSLL